VTTGDPLAPAWLELPAIGGVTSPGLPAKPPVLPAVLNGGGNVELVPATPVLVPLEWPALPTIGPVLTPPVPPVVMTGAVEPAAPTPL
jgi:hypothetical protein